MLLQPDKSFFIVAIIKEVEEHENRYNWKLMKKSEVKNKHKYSDGKMKTILSIWSFKLRILPDRILMEQKTRFFPHGGIQQWGVNYWENYSPVVNWISVRLLLDIAIIHEFSSISIDFVLEFNQSDLDVDVLIDLNLGMGVNGNRGEWVLKLKVS